MDLDAGFGAYILAQLALTAGALWLSVVRLERARFGAWVRFLAHPWRALTFATALAGIVWIAPYTGDPYWDYVDAAVMATATFLSAPWAVGLLGRVVAGRERAAPIPLFVAAVACLFASSWSYDLWLVWRDGAYPETWLANLAVSPILYVFAGFFWSLEHRPDRGVTLAFLEPTWPPPESAGFRRVLWLALPIMALIAALMVSSAVGWT